MKHVIPSEQSGYRGTFKAVGPKEDGATEYGTPLVDTGAAIVYFVAAPHVQFAVASTADNAVGIIIQ